MIKEVANILTEIKNSDGKLQKEKVISDNKNNQLFLDVLNHLYNPYVKTNIAKRKLSKAIVLKPKSGNLNIYEYMTFLQKATGTDEEIGVVQSYIESQLEEVRWLLESLATKDLKIGITLKTINKALGYDLIPQFELMLSDKWIDSSKSKKKIINNWERMIDKEVVATTKLDGIRAVVFVTEDGVKMYSRSGHELDGYIDLEKEFKKLAKGYVYDGEIVAKNFDNLDSKELFQLTSSKTRSKGIKKDVDFWAFDMINIDEFKKGISETKTSIRKGLLQDLIEEIDGYDGLENTHYVYPLYEGVFNKDELEELSDRAKNNGLEGIMVQLSDAPYECKRTKDILKMKAFESADLRCVDLYEGKTGKNIGKLGGLVLNYKGHLVNIGGGFTDEQRDIFWNNRNLVLNKIIEINYFEEFENEDGRLDLRFGTFKEVRNDKDEESYY